MLYVSKGSWLFYLQSLTETNSYKKNSALVMLFGSAPGCWEGQLLEC
jgi:hypothetical protein